MDKQKPNWDKILNEYVTSSLSYRKLAEKWGVSAATLTHRAIKENWVNLRKKQYSKIKAKLEQKNDKLAEEAADEIVDRNQTHIEIWDLLAKRAIGLLVENKSKRIVGFNIEDIELGTDDLEKLSRALDKAQRGHRLALGLDREDATKPEDRPIINDDIS